MIKLSRETYLDKVMGCWKGKMAGGTLGMPLEEMWGKKEPFNVSFYEVGEIEGGIPNDDLEIQLIWLMLLEDRGLDITCRDMAEYWLNTINYNPDEYAMHKTNLRQGLMPPVSGSYNNHFKDCMGSPIRSEIWACLAPGMPHVAAHYAWHDSVVDHAEGESLYGEIFNAAVESAAFFISDRDTLLDMGLSVIPEGSKTAQTIRKARQLHSEGKDFMQARNGVMEFAYHPNGQHSPINLGFQTVAWLYGEGFGDTICKAVNCGWDTDCTAATIGSILGIIHGSDGIPQKWMEPLGNEIKTSEVSGGLRNLRVPETLEELTSRVAALTPGMLAKHGNKVLLVDEAVDHSPSDFDELIDHDAFDAILSRRQDMTEHVMNFISVGVAYPNGPVISHEDNLNLEVHLTNRTPDLLEGRFDLVLPSGFHVAMDDNRFVIEPSGMVEKRVTVSVDRSANILTANKGLIHFDLKDLPAVDAVPVVAIGARRWMVSPLLPGDTLESNDAEILRQVRTQELPVGWQVLYSRGNENRVEPFFKGQAGVLYLNHYLYNPQTREARLGVPNNGRMKFWLDGALVQQTAQTVPLRPSNWGDGVNYVDLALAKGWHHVVIKLERGDEPLQTHFVASYDPPLWHGIHDLTQTVFPWDQTLFPWEPNTLQDFENEVVAV